MSSPAAPPPTDVKWAPADDAAAAAAAEGIAAALRAVTASDAIGQSAVDPAEDLFKPGAASEPRPSLKDCRSRACAGVVDTFRRALRPPGLHNPSPTATTPVAPSSATQGDGATAAEPPSEAAAATTAAAASAPGAEADDAGADGAVSGSAECPPDTWELGRCTWTFLHSVAAHYPDQPSSQQQQLMRGLLDGLVEFYPCEICAEHLREQVKDKPPQVATAQELNLWLCGLHNEVNELLGKPLFDCSRVLERWRDGPDDGSCD